MYDSIVPEGFPDPFYEADYEVDGRVNAPVLQIDGDAFGARICGREGPLKIMQLDYWKFVLSVNCIF